MMNSTFHVYKCENGDVENSHFESSDFQRGGRVSKWRLQLSLGDFYIYLHGRRDALTVTEDLVQRFGTQNIA